MLNISFCSDSLSLRTASLISPLPLQPELCPQSMRGSLIGAAPLPSWCSLPLRAPPPPNQSQINVASTGPGQDSVLKNYLWVIWRHTVCSLAPDLQGPTSCFGVLTLTHKSGLNQLGSHSHSLVRTSSTQASFQGTQQAATWPTSL